MAADADGFISVSDTRRGRRQQQRVDVSGQKKTKKGQRRAQAAVASPLLRTEEELLEYSPTEVIRLVTAVQQLRFVCMHVCMYAESTIDPTWKKKG
jgi:hypothetical protein